jgi:thioredoxin-related protein
MMKHILFLTLTVALFGCNNARNHSSAQSATPPKPKNFERVYPPALLTDARERANFLVTHFWDHFNFKDTMYAHTPDITEQAFVDYISFFQYASPEKIREGVAKLMKSAEADSVMFAYFARESEHYFYEPNSPFRNDEYFIPFLEQIVNSSIVDDAHKIRPRYLLNLTYRNRPGDKAADVQYMQANGKQGNLYSIKAEYLLLMFYNPGCKECQNTMGMIQNSAEIAPLIKNGTIKVLMVYPDENLDKWKEHIAEVPSNWINGYDKSLSIREKEVYDLKAIPTLYLLDKDKKVILKDCSVGDINEFLKK